MPSCRRSFPFLAIGLALGGLFAASPASLAEERVERIEPPLAQRGKTTRVTFIGSHLKEALDLWSSLPSGDLKATRVGDREANRATFEVHIAAHAAVGLCGIRVATPDGLSNTHLFLIEDLPPVARLAHSEPMKASLPAAVWGTLRGAAVDRFTLDVATGQRVSFEVVGSRFGKDIDPLVTIRDAQGKWLAERDNDPGLCFDCRFEHVFAAAGRYTVEVRDARFQAPENTSYVLRMGRFPAGRVALPSAVRPGQRSELLLPEAGAPPFALDVPGGQRLGPFVASLRRAEDEGSTWVPLVATEGEVTVAHQPCDTPDRATQAKVPGMLCGVLYKPGIRDHFRIDLDKGQRIRVRGEARSLHSPADLEMAITDAKGIELRRNSDAGREPVVLDFTAPAAGSFNLIVRDLARDGGPAYVYRLDVRAPQPSFSIDADVEGLTVPRGAYQALPLTVTRSERLGAIKLRMVGAPAGLTLAPAEIAEGENSVICKLAAGADAPLGLLTLQIVAEAASPDSGIAPILVRTLPLIDRRRVNVDLIPYALRDDQRLLPAPLTDRLAVQVISPAPFTMELTEPLITLGRYQHADLPILTTRVTGFDGPITFSARGGQLAEKDDVRTRVYAEFPTATASQPQATGRIHSRILSNLGRTRIDVIGTAVHQGRCFTLQRSFDLDLRPAFRVSAETEKLALTPGSAAKVRLLANRVKTFDGPIALQITPVSGLDLPTTVQIPRGQDSVEVEFNVAVDALPRRVVIRAHCLATVGSYEEEQQGQLVEIEIRKPEGAKK